MTFHPSIYTDNFSISFKLSPSRNIEWNRVSFQKLFKARFQDWTSYHVITNSKSRRMTRSSLASNITFLFSRAIFFITLFVMNYKVASLEIIRGSRDPVFFFFFLISLVRLISSKREEMFIVSVKDRNYSVSLVSNFFFYLFKCDC